MDINEFLRSIIEQERAAVVVCDLEHKIIYMNPSADKRYSKKGGYALVGKNLLDCHNEKSNVLIKKVVQWFFESTENNYVHTYYNEKENKDVYMVALRDNNKKLIGYYEKHEYRAIDNGDFYDFL